MKVLKYGLVCVSVALLSGCTSAIYRKTNSNIDSAQAALSAANFQSGHAAPAVIVKPGYYVSDQGVSLKRTPSWLTQDISLQANGMPMQVLMQRLFHGKDVVLTYDGSVQSQRPITMDYSGTVKGALDNVAADTGYVYLVTGDHVAWSNYETKTFNISFMPGSSTYLLGRGKGGGSEKSSSGSQGTNSVGGIEDNQYSSLTGNVSIWNDLSNTLNQLKSADGNVIVSQSTTSVTVHDHPANVAAMTRYIKQLNTTLSEEVAIKVRVLDVELNKEFNYGINWNLVGQVLHNTYKISGALGDATNLALGSVARSSGSGLSKFQIGGGDTNAVVEALSQQGRVSTVTQPQVVTINNQIASIRITRDTGYIQSVSSTSNQTNSTNSIVPGNITSGFTLYVLPKIQDNRVYMQISSTIANLVNLQKVSNNPDSGSSSSSTTPSTGTDTKQPTYQAIEVPTLTSKAFNQRSVVDSGTTLVIAGYQSLTDRADKASLFGVGALGGKGSESDNEQTVILITPVILGAH
jgi:MSHA biogenesis protein MshL